MSSPKERPLHTKTEIPPVATEEATVPPPDVASLTAPYVPKAETSGKLPTQLPALFGRYQLQKLLGQGGMGAVYLAHDSQLDRSVALKIPLFHADEGSQVLGRFYREARAAATISHPNVCSVYDVGDVDGVPYLTMAYIEGKSLAEWIQTKPLTPKQSAFLVRKLALALQEAHKKGVIHRDLKPANIMIDKRGEPVIMDFGLARRNRPGDARLTQQGTVMGTPAYMPPEQVGGKSDAMGPACDIYSLGVILYELVAGRLPFQGDPMAMLSQVLLDEPPPPSQFRPGLDEALEKICLKALTKKIEGRYASMIAFASALLDYLRSSTPTSSTALVAKVVKPAAKETHAPEGETADWRTAVEQTSPRSRIIKKAEPKQARRRSRKVGRSLGLWIASGAAAVLVSGVLVFLLWPKRVPNTAQPVRSVTPAPIKSDPVPPPSPPKPPPADLVVPAADGFVPLFNGKDLSGWETGSGDPTVWRVEDGVLMFQVADTGTQQGWIVTERDYTNFLLQFDFQLTPGANSGVGLRMWRHAPKPLVIQIQDDTSPTFAGVPPTQRTGSLLLVAGGQAELRPLGEWNHMEIEVQGWSLRVAVNGKQTLHMQLNDDAVFRYLNGAPPASGRIGLNDCIGSVRFRKLQIKELPQTAERKDNP